MYCDEIGGIFNHLKCRHGSQRLFYNCKPTNLLLHPKNIPNKHLVYIDLLSAVDGNKYVQVVSKVTIDLYFL